jgi:hypothetical protein
VLFTQSIEYREGDDELEVNAAVGPLVISWRKFDSLVTNIVFWDVAPCGSGLNRRFGGTYHLPSSWQVNNTRDHRQVGDLIHLCSNRTLRYCWLHICFVLGMARALSTKTGSSGQEPWLAGMLWACFTYLTSITSSFQGNQQNRCLPSPEDGNRSSFRNVVFLSPNSLESGRWTKSENPLILCVIHHRQNPIESTSKHFPPCLWHWRYSTTQ